MAGIINGADNSDDLNWNPEDTGYNLVDEAAVLSAAASDILDGAVDITATDAASVAEAGVIAGADNSGTTTYSIADSAAAILSEEDANGSLEGTILGDAIGIETSDASAVDLTVSEVETLNDLGAVIPNGYNVVDSLAEISVADPTIIDDATSYTLTDTGPGLGFRTDVDEAVIIEGATNAADYEYSLEAAVNDIFAGHSQTDNGFVNATSITHTGVGVAANPNAIGTDGVDDVFVFDPSADSNTDIVSFEGGENLDVLDFTAMDLGGNDHYAIASTSDTTLADARVIVVSGPAAGDTESDILDEMNGRIDTSVGEDSDTIIVVYPLN